MRVNCNDNSYDNNNNNLIIISTNVRKQEMEKHYKKNKEITIGNKNFGPSFKLALVHLHSVKLYEIQLEYEEYSKCLIYRNQNEPSPGYQQTKYP